MPDPMAVRAQAKGGPEVVVALKQPTVSTDIDAARERIWDSLSLVSADGYANYDTCAACQHVYRHAQMRRINTADGTRYIVICRSCLDFAIRHGVTELMERIGALDAQAKAGEECQLADEWEVMVA